MQSDKPWVFSAWSLVAAGLLVLPGLSFATVTPDIPNGSLTYGVSEDAPKFMSVSGNTAGSVTLGGASAGGGFLPSDVFVNGDIPITSETNVEASASAYINFEIVGPSGGIATIDISGTASGWAQGDGISSGGVFLYALGDRANALTVDQFLHCTATPSTTPCGGSFLKPYSVQTNTVYTVLAEAGGGFISDPTATTSGPGSFSAIVDPPSFVSIDPGFAATHPDYVLVVNTGGPVSSVPEPGSLSQLALGLGALCIARRAQLRARSNLARPWLGGPEIHRAQGKPRL